MNTRMFIALAAALVLSLSLTFAQTKEECITKATTASKSCCKEGSKASLTSKGTTAAIIVAVSDKHSGGKSSKECTMKDAKASADDCSDAEKANCNMKKTAMTKAGGKMDCCKDKAKSAKAEKKTRTEKSEAKGTN